MSSWRAYIAPLNEDGGYDDYVEITDYVIGNNVGTIARKTESNDFDIGVAPNDSVSLKLNNSTGRFSEAGSLNSIFPTTRENALVKITFLFGLYAPICGTAIAGQDVLGPEIDAFEGFLVEKNIKQDIIDDTISISILGKETYFDKFEADTSFVYPTSFISEAIYDLLNVGDAYSLFDISLSNINPTIDVQLNTINDDVALEFLKGNTARESINLLLESSNSVMYIEANVLYVTDRVANSNEPYRFYGQASNFGLENIQNIKGYKSGINRTFNLWKWQDTDLSARSSSSIATYGVVKHDDIDYKATNIAAARQNLLDSYRDEFSVPKIEMRLTTVADVETIALRLFDKVVIDYPDVPVAVGAGNLPAWNTGSMVWQAIASFNPEEPFFSWPDGLFNIQIKPDQEWKITGISTSSDSDLITFNLREV